MACFNLLCKLLFYVLYSSGCRKLVKNRRETSLSFPIIGQFNDHFFIQNDFD